MFEYKYQTDHSLILIDSCYVHIPSIEYVKGSAINIEIGFKSGKTIKIHGMDLKDFSNIIQKVENDRKTKE